VSDSHPFLSRREILRAAALAGVGLSIGGLGHGANNDRGKGPITKRIPRTRENLPVIGLGTNAYRAETPEEMAALRAVLRRMPDLGGTVIDTAPAYGRSEMVLGQLLMELGNRDRFFLATKVTAPGDDPKAGAEMLEESLRRLRTERVDLMQVHNLSGVDVLMPVLRDWKAAGKTRYLGITTSRSEDYGSMIEFMRRHPLDFIQVDYSIDNRAAAEKVLPLAHERQVGVLINMPLGGRRTGNLLARLKNKPLPPWAADLGAASWPQFLLKYVASHPAVTVVIPGTTKVHHLEDNQRAARAPMPNAKTRKRMEEFWDAMGE
jgi:aryl-alcohol dehydrogenase-like predicted oxidoreductase